MKTWKLEIEKINSKMNLVAFGKQLALLSI